jgi:glutathione synthase/RimK-type ligase-like ATP-grasp enzyme
MSTIYLRCAKEHNQSIRVLTQLLTEAGHEVVNNPPTNGSYATVCWGMSSTVEGVLNGKVNRFNKMQALDKFMGAGCKVPEITIREHVDRITKWPQLARKVEHKCGRDIIVCRNRFQARRALERGRTWFSEFIPTETEYRVWVFRKRVLGVYEKIWKGEGEFTGCVRNHRFGFQFQKRDDLRKSEAIATAATSAVKSIEMDFGAVDLIKGKDGELYVLEVNSMPNIDNPKRSSGIRLCSSIGVWADKDVNKAETGPNQ